MTNMRQIVVIAVVLAVHVAVDLVLSLVAAPRGLTIHDPHPLFLACVAWPMSQASLVAIWVAMSRIRSYLRFWVALLGLSCTWLLLVAVVPLELQHPECASYAALFIVQALVILLVVAASRWARRRSNAGSDRSRRLQYDVGTLLIWTACLAATLGLGRLVFTRLGWTGAGVVAQAYFFFTIVIGVGNAACALLVLASLLGRTWWFVRICLGLLAVGMLGGLVPLLLEWLFGDTGGIEITGFLILAGSQAVYLYATLVPLRWAGWLGAARSRAEPAAATARESGNPFAR
jgi:hypothetical protein